MFSKYTIVKKLRWPITLAIYLTKTNFNSRNFQFKITS